MDIKMDFSNTEPKPHVTTLPQYSAPPIMYNRPNPSPEQPLLPGYIFMCNGRTKTDCFRYRVFGLPRGRKDVIQTIKPGMKLFLYDFEKKLLYGVYEATVNGMLDIEPEAFERMYPAQVGFRIVNNCYPLPENAFKSVVSENYKGAKFKQELSPHQVMSLLSLFRSFNSPELDSLPQRLAAIASGTRSLSFEERFIAATQIRNGEPRMGSLMAHQSVPFQHGYSRGQENYVNSTREGLSLSSQPYYPTEGQQQRGDPSRPPIQDPQLKYLTTLCNIRRYGSASENEYNPANPSEKDQFTSPYSDNNNNKYHSSGSSAAHGEASQQHHNISGGNYYHPEPSMQSDRQAVSVVSQSRNETAGYPTQSQGQAVGYHPQSVSVTYATTHSQPGSVEESTQSYSGYAQQQYYAAMGNTTHQLYAGANGYVQQPHETVYAQQPQGAQTEYSQQSHAAATTYAQQQPQAVATGYTQQPQTLAAGYPQLQAATAEYAQQTHAGASGYAQQPHAATTGYSQQPQGTPTGYSQQSHAAATAFAQQQPQAIAKGYAQLQAAAAEYAQQTQYTQQTQAGMTGYAQQPQAIAKGYAQLQAAAAEYAQQTQYTQQTQAGVTGYAQQPQAAATGPYAAATGYAPQAQAAGYTGQPHAEAVGYSQPGPADWNAAYQSYYAQTADATKSYNQKS